MNQTPAERLRLLVYPPLQPGQEPGDATDAIALDPRRTACVLSTALPGGFETAQVGLFDPWATGWLGQAALPRPLEVRDFGHVALWAGRRLAWEGRAEKFTYQGGALVGFEAYGYGTNYLKEDSWYASRESNIVPDAGFTSTAWLGNERTTRSLIADVLLSAAPLVRLADDFHAQDPGLMETPFRYYGQTPAQVLDQACKAGDGSGPWDYSVWEARRLWLRPRALPADVAPDYQVALGPAVAWVRDLTQTTGAVTVEFTLPAWDLVDVGNEASLLTGVPNPGGAARPTAGANAPLETPEVPDDSFVARFGIRRRTRIKGGAMPPQFALATARSTLASRRFAADTVTLTCEGGLGLPVGGGGVVAAEAVRAGQWAGFTVPAGGLGGLGQTPLPIVKTRYDAHSGQLQVTLGTNAQTLVALLSELRTLGRHQVLDTNPRTGAPRR